MCLQQFRLPYSKMENLQLFIHTSIWPRKSNVFNLDISSPGCSRVSSSHSSIVNKAKRAVSAYIDPTYAFR